MTTENIKVTLGHTASALLKVAGIIGAISIIAGGYSIYMNHVWKPKIEILNVDFERGKAKIKIGGAFGKIIDIDGDAVFLVAADWGIRFGTIMQDGKSIYHRLELLRKGMVYEYLDKQQ